MKKIITMGEIMLRLSTPRFERFLQSKSFDIDYGGGEANVAVSLANFGYDSYLVTKLPDNDIGESAIRHLKKNNVNTDYISFGGDRIGVYYLETGVSMRPSKIIYDRDHSSITEAEVTDFDFDKIFRGADWFHLSGITPALSEKATILTEQALMAAKKHGVTTSLDVNYRKSLWTPEKAREVMFRLMKYVDVCIDGHFMFGFDPATSYNDDGTMDLTGYKNIFKEMKDQFNFKYVVSTIRKSYSASDNSLYALIYDGNEFYQSKKYDLRIIDRVGGGDSFASGLIYGLLAEKDFKDALEFGVAASALKHTIHGDFNMVTVEEVRDLVAQDNI